MADLHQQKLKTKLKKLTFYVKMLVILLNFVFFFRRFLHIFVIANHLRGFSISGLLNMEDF